MAWKLDFPRASDPRKSKQGDFPGGAVVKNLPANAGDTGSSPIYIYRERERSHHNEKPAHCKEE